MLCAKCDGLQSDNESLAENATDLYLAKVHECAKAALFFGSDYAQVVTGAALDVNGGEYMPV